MVHNNIFILPFKLIKIYLQHKQIDKKYQANIKINPKLTLPKLQDYSDYQEGLKLRKHLSYLLGDVFLKACKRKWGLIKFILIDVPKIRKKFKQNKF
ncbi:MULTISPECIES: alpha-2,3-sialyltransferase [unclassified Campylobacter]|uniref:alpha-2,3-sialyltransferase n=1 Tax=unclassified Campylobacter TaxID=2593542 RepID=UPI001237C04B|nr:MULTISPECIES: alpha-2,3-sialyltransferase [unclassified Campylobacter]KAA6224948.1 alpha-2,3-sialyltransferase [Campylobacter sp. LR286c]KAA6228388.1 alpha-2,3-sialyltransferase [Campylobacter sp. LR185c]KAA6228874.1 alpha-2,3-sialyltransferase [Campylobacter sp. LR196d]KAA8603763.1 alpha-2,3-sialyltransferase [Campylobacter sp. LR185c]